MSSGTKKLLNSVDTCVDECLAGLVAAHPLLVLHPKQRVVFDGSPAGSRKVAVISGGGAGHEPFSTGYVGSGMLTAAISGSVFAAPPSTHVLHAIRQASRVSPGGVLVLIPNYTGDILNFGLAVQLAKSEGIQVENLVVGEDIAHAAMGSLSRAGRRGMCGLVVLFKITGSFARSGAMLFKLHATASNVLTNLASIGLALSACTLPGSSTPLFQLEQNEMELGVGVHGEAGIQRLTLLTAAEAVATFLQHIISYLKLNSGDEVAVFVNNLGGLSQLEQWVVANEIRSQLISKRISVARLYAAPLFTSINMVGVQVCCLRLPKEVREEWLQALDEDTAAPAWPGSAASIPYRLFSPFSSEEEDRPAAIVQKGLRAGPDEAKAIHRCLDRVTDALVKSEERLNLLDSCCGDGDCGTTLRHLAAGIRRSSEAGELLFEYPTTLASQIAGIAATTMGGTSGAIYSLFLTYAGTTLEKAKDLKDPALWAKVWRAAIDGVKKYSIARIGDRTMFDALEPACDTFLSAVSEKVALSVALGEAVNAAKDGCQLTKNMRARAGRASYVDAALVNEVDAGAYAVTVWVTALAEALSSQQY